jgi:hypothetical protein
VKSNENTTEEPLPTEAFCHQAGAAEIGQLLAVVFPSAPVTP